MIIQRIPEELIDSSLRQKIAQYLANYEGNTLGLVTLVEKHFVQ